MHQQTYRLIHFFLDKVRIIKIVQMSGNESFALQSTKYLRLGKKRNEFLCFVLDF